MPGQRRRWLEWAYVEELRLDEALHPLTILAVGLYGRVLPNHGLLALVFLVASLACTLLKAVFGWTWPMRLRWSLGLLSFGYAVLRFATYATLDQGLDLAAVTADVVKRRFIFVGFAAFVLLVPLAATSNQRVGPALGAGIESRDTGPRLGNLAGKRPG